MHDREDRVRGKVAFNDTLHDSFRVLVDTISRQYIVSPPRFVGVLMRMVLLTCS